MGMPYPFPGGTTAGIKGDGCVALVSEKRFSYGYFVVSKAARKVFQISDTVGGACAGMVADMQILLRDATAFVNLYTLEQRTKPAVQTVAKILSNYLFGSRFYPYLTETIIAGVDSTGPHVFVLDALGSMIEDDYAVVGSGAEIAIGVIESNYRKDLQARQLYDLAVKAVKSSISRDAASGNGIDVLVFTNKGVEINETVPL